MKISIIVPVYNSEKYLYKCIQSVVSQNPVECEMIPVDDGSTDKSLDMMNKAAEKYPYIRVMHQTNQGVSMARNTGLKAASGEWIYFLDSDDELEEHALDIMLKYIQNDCQWIIFNYSKLIAETKKRYVNEMAEAEYELHRDKEAFPQLLNEQVFMLQGGKLYRRDLIEKQQLYFKKRRCLWRRHSIQYAVFSICQSIHHIEHSNLCIQDQKSEGAGSAYYEEAFQMQMDIDQEILYMVKIIII